MRATILLALVLPAAVALAHGPTQQNETTFDGEVTAVGKSEFVMKTSDAGNATVKINDSTKFRRWDGPAAQDELTPGMQVTVHGSRLRSGNLVATDVMLGIVVPSETPASPLPSPSRTEPR